MEAWGNKPASPAANGGLLRRWSQTAARPSVLFLLIRHETLATHSSEIVLGCSAADPKTSSSSPARLSSALIGHRICDDGPSAQQIHKSTSLPVCGVCRATEPNTSTRMRMQLFNCQHCVDSQWRVCLTSLVSSLHIAKPHGLRKRGDFVAHGDEFLADETRVSHASSACMMGG